MSDDERPSPEGLRASVRAFRFPGTTTRERDAITAWWGRLGIPNQFAAMLRAAEMEKTTKEAR